MEKNVKLKTGDGHVIHGTLNTGTKTSKILVIFVHGLTGHQHEHNFHTAASQFPKKGVDVFRFSLYTDEKGGRRLSACTIQTHAEDLNIVTKHFRKNTKLSP
jgi:predicted alpha/beta-fold hydrolase